MTRRTVLQALATVCAWPFLRLRARADAGKGIPTPAIEPIEHWIRLFDGETLVEERKQDAYDLLFHGRPIIVPTMPAPGATWLGMGRTVFAPRSGPRGNHEVYRFDGDGSNGRLVRRVYYYDYVSGPKWWVSDRWDEARWDGSDGYRCPSCGLHWPAGVYVPDRCECGLES